MLLFTSRYGNVDKLRLDGCVQPKAFVKLICFSVFSIQWLTKSRIVWKRPRRPNLLTFFKVFHRKQSKLTIHSLLSSSVN